MGVVKINLENANFYKIDIDEEATQKVESPHGSGGSNFVEPDRENILPVWLGWDGGQAGIGRNLDSE